MPRHLPLLFRLRIAALGCLLPLLARAAPDSVVVFNEIHYHPSISQTAGEWIELHNQHAVNVDISGWRLDGGVSYLIPPGSVIPAGGYKVIAADPAALALASGLASVLGPFTGALSNGGESVVLRNHNQRVMDELAYADAYPWPLGADGSGATLAKRRPLTASADPFLWTASREIGGTPGAANFPVAAALAADPSHAGALRYFPWDSDGADTSGHGLVAVLRNGAVIEPEFAPAPGPGSGQCLNLDGVDDHAEILDSWHPPAYTIAAWIKPDQIRAQGLWVRTSAAGPNAAFSHQLRMTAAGVFEHYTFDGGGPTVTGTTVAQADQWVHVAAVAGNGGAIRLYVNGVEQGAPAAVGALWSGGDRWQVGSAAAGLPAFDGRIDDLVFYPAAFDDAAVQALYQGTLRPTMAPPRNLALGRTVINGSGAYNQNPFNVSEGANNFTALRVTDGSDRDVFGTNYWLGRQGTANEWFILDLGAPVDVRWLLLRNTHNTQYNDRGTRNFQVWGAGAVDASNLLVSPTLMLTGLLQDVDGQNPILGQAFTSQNGLATGSVRYLKFQVVSNEPSGAGLNEIEVFDSFGPPPPAPSGQNFSVRFNEVAAANDSPWWVELHNTESEPLDLQTLRLDFSSGATTNLPSRFVGPQQFAVVDSTELGLLPLPGDEVHLVDAAGTRWFDSAECKAAHQFRLPGDSRGEFWETTNSVHQTPGEANPSRPPCEVVINEIQYHARPQVRDGAVPYAENPEEWIELFNRGTQPVSLDGWRLDEAIRFTFPSNTVLGAGAYLVVALDPVAFATAHPGVPALGGWSGQLSNQGERIFLRDTLGNRVDEVHYRTRAPWPAHPDGGGSTLELRDPFADNAVPEAWADSEEAGRSTWQTYDFTLVAQTPLYSPTIGSFHELRLGLLDGGELLLDDVSVREDPSGTNRELMQNGSFDAGASAWRLLGTHERSSVILDSGNPVLHVVADGPHSYQVNLIETSLKADGALVPVVDGRAYRFQFRAKWLKGSPQLQVELYYNKTARTVVLPQPAMSGTPGAENSTRVANHGPTFLAPRHSPAVPAALSPVSVSVQVEDPQGVASVTLRASVSGGGWTSAPMALGSDGRWSAPLSGQAAAVVTQFYVEAVDGQGAVSTWPQAGPASRALIQVKDGRATPGRRSLRLIATAADTTALYTTSDMINNRLRGCTLVLDEEEVLYDSLVRLRGSMFTRNNPASTCLHVETPSDQPLRGVHRSFMVRASSTVEILAKHLISSARDLPDNYNDCLQVVGPRNDVGGLCRLEMMHIDEDYFEDALADGSTGAAFKMEGIRVYTTTVDGNPESKKLAWPTIGWVAAFDLTNQGSDPEIYRDTLRITSNRSRDDYTKIVAMNQAFGLPAGPGLDSAVAASIDVDQWMRLYALESLCEIGDAYGMPSENPHNLNFYSPPGARGVVAVPWDWSFFMNNGDTSAVLPPNKNLAKVCARPVFARLFWGHIQDLCNTVYNQAYMAPWLSHYGACFGANWTGYGARFEARRAHALSQLPSVLPFAITTNGGNPVMTPEETLDLVGTGWIDVREVRLNGGTSALAVEWLDGQTWRVRVPVAPGSNTVTLSAFNHSGTQVGVDSIGITGVGSVVPAAPGHLVFSEIHYNPGALQEGEFVELMNVSTNTVSLTGCWFSEGIEFAFADGVTLAPGGRLVVGKAQFLNGSGLNNGGERITLTAPGGVVLCTARYADTSAWPAADGTGRTLTLIAPRAGLELDDPSHWRVSVDAGGSPGGTDALPPPLNPFADANANGAADLVEYVLVPPTLDPLAAQSPLTARFVRRLAADSANWVVEVSPDLITWTAGAERVAAEETAPGLIQETWRIAPAPGSEGLRYLRMRVELR